MPYALALANRGWRDALIADPGLRAGLNVAEGRITNEPVARSLGLDYTPPERVLGME